MKMKATLEPGETIGAYEVERFIAAGGYGEVYAVLDKNGKRFALKLFVLRTQSDKRGAKRLAAEAEALRKIKHTNVVRYHDAHFSPQTNTVYVVMEYLEGITLRQLLRVEGAQRVERALDLVRQMCSGLAKAHDKGIIHRDIKPENIMVGKGDIVKVVDFGVAKMIGLHMGTTAGIGTPAYMSPEATRYPESPDPRWDVFAVGLVLFELLTGLHAYADDEGKLPANPLVIVTWHAERRPIKRVDDVTPGILKPVADLVARAVDMDMEARFPTMLEMERAIERIHEQLHPAMDQSARAWMTSSDEEIADTPPESPLAFARTELNPAAKIGPAGTDIIATPDEAIAHARARGLLPSGKPLPAALDDALLADLQSECHAQLREAGLTLGTDAALELLAKTLLAHTDPRRRAAAAVEAIRLADARLLHPLLRIYAKEKVPLVRQLMGAAATACGNTLPTPASGKRPASTPAPQSIPLPHEAPLPEIAEPDWRQLLTFDWHDAGALLIGILGGGTAAFLLDMVRRGGGG